MIEFLLAILIFIWEIIVGLAIAISVPLIIGFILTWLWNYLISPLGVPPVDLETVVGIIFILGMLCMMGLLFFGFERGW